MRVLFFFVSFHFVNFQLCVPNIICQYCYAILGNKEFQIIFVETSFRLYLRAKEVKSNSCFNNFLMFYRKIIFNVVVYNFEMELLKLMM
jgi:hypothetical protein